MSFLFQKIVPLERISNRHIDAMQCVSGAQIISSLHSKITKSSLGFIELLEEKEVQQNKSDCNSALLLTLNCRYLFISPVKGEKTKAQPISTIIYCAGDSFALQELE